jgi:hypothetical protein
MKRILGVAILGLSALSSVSAQAGTGDPGWQLGIAALFGDYSLQGGAIDDNSVGAKVSGQYRFNQYFGVEGAWLSTGNFETDAASSNGGVDAKISLQGYQLDLIGYLPWSPDNVQIYGKFGMYDLDQDLDFDGTTSRSANGITAGLGFGMAMNERILVRLDGDWYDFSDDADFWTVSLGAYYHFGD